MPRFDPDRLQRELDARSLTVKALAQAASISPSTVQVARHGKVISLRAQRAILRAIHEIPELPHLDLVAGSVVRGNGARKDGDHQAGQPVVAEANLSAQAPSSA